MKQQPSFGMKMNNQNVVQKDKVSFGMFTMGVLGVSAISSGIVHIAKESVKAQVHEDDQDGQMLVKSLELTEHICGTPLRIAKNVIDDFGNIPEQAMNETKKAVKEMKGHGFKGVVKGVSKVAGAPVSAITTTFHEVKKDLQDRPSTPREKKARIVVDTYTAGTAATGAALGAIPFVGSGVDSFKVSPDQRKLMVNEIADIYKLSREEKYDLYESLNLDDYNRFEGPITDVVSISGKKAAEYIAKEATSEVIQEGASQIASVIPGAKSYIRAGVNSVSAKKLGEKAIQECKRLAKRH